MKKLLLLAIALATASMFGQPTPTSVSEVEKGIQMKQQEAKTSIVKNLNFESIGPTIMSGRVVDLAVNPDNPIEFYVGYASGGVWYTNNNGTSFEPVLDTSPTQNVGSLAVDWKNKVIWVGTGEVNSSRSSYAGIGLLKSIDGGKNWENRGLKDTHHISKIILNPDNPDEILVSAVGHLYSTNSERGVYKSLDGGASWERTLFVNDQTGIIEMDADPNNFNLVYATAWDKDRKAWNFRGNGDGSGIYKSTDAGNTWTEVSTEKSGFPIGEGVGRIGVAVVDANTVYAIHDSQFRREQEKKDTDDNGMLTKEDFKTMTVTDFLALDNNRLKDFLRQNGFQEKYRPENVKNMVKSGSVKPIDLAKYLEDANTLLFDTPVIGAEVYKSTDGGVSWKKTHEGYLDGIYYSYGYYFGKIHVDPNNSNKIYIYGVPILKSEDGGKTFTSIAAENVHADHHALWINPKMPGHLINGNDGGVNITYDDGKTWIKNNAPAVGQFYTVNVDNEKPYNVYGGLQDNGVWKGAHNSNMNFGWHQRGENPYKFIMGGDGMQVQIDSRNTDIVYTGFQFGNYFRLDLSKDEQTYIQPKHELGEAPYRFNWQTPIQLSSHNEDILYLGGNKLMRSMNRGNDWESISGDLTKGGKPGNVAYGTLSSISESPIQFGLIYTGSDDGMVHVTRNGGGSWTNISTSFPADLWVSRVIASQHKKERVYVTLNGYRWDDFKPYVYVSESYGQSWQSISKNLPVSPVNVIKEDPENEDVLYLGTDNGAWVSFDRGNSWQVFVKGLPNVAVHDMVVQEREKDLLLGTHGRSFYKADTEVLQQMTGESMSEVLMANIAPIRSSRRWGSSFSTWSDTFTPSIDIQFYSPSGGEVTVMVTDDNGVTYNEFTSDVDLGINTIEYDLSVSEKGVKAMKKRGKELKKQDNGMYYLPKGEYTVKIFIEGKSDSTTLEIK
ncbi:glycosyl hydrolase [Aureitalea sp. L0-47]|uniref:exo-alpha-sialidase n=1 Tax=Aureitalea sp. L0-47 TaxID=2816962 RepID=UPI002237985A|nr:exo-alpha-sialidase [Aureitalea sp. L0-47]MCW5518333.1 glycosyl hydrolase [Aureitalea sp. L0-47]